MRHLRRVFERHFRLKPPITGGERQVAANGRILPFLLRPQRLSKAGGLLGAPAIYEVPRKACSPTDAHQPCPGLNSVDVDRRGPMDHNRERQADSGTETRPW